MAHIRARLSRWYKVTKRDLPWRRSREPYAIWVSEIMLQQTQVATVIPFYERFIQRFPTLGILAKADEQEVLRYWEGLGYYRRARQLHQAAQLIMTVHGGSFPTREEKLSELPGFGRYTVGAVLSQAFDLRLPAVEANVSRVLSRLGAWKHPLEHQKTRTWLWETAAKLLPQKGAGNFNQALMELGQMVCLPHRPSCLLCPVKEVCRGQARGIAHSLPRRSKKPLTVEITELALIISRKDRLLLCQRRSDAARWANMWEFPTKELVTSRPLPQQTRALASQLVGYRVSSLRRFAKMRYGITRFRVTLVGMEARFLGGRSHRNTYQTLKWISAADLNQFPLSVPQRRLARKWVEHHKLGQQ